MFSNSRVLDIAAGLRHSVAVTGVDNDAFYITTVENFIQHVCWTLCWTSRSLTNPQMAGRLATIFHPPENGSIYSWGDGKKGQLGHGGRELKVQPTPKCGQTFCPCPTNSCRVIVSWLIPRLHPSWGCPSSHA